jgi:hypothetical protein
MNVKCGCSTGFSQCGTVCFLSMLRREDFCSAQKYVAKNAAEASFNADVIKPNRSFVDCTKTLFSAILAMHKQK